MEISDDLKEYLDLDDALSRIGGNLGLYKRLLGKFVEGNHSEELINALQSGSAEDAIRQAHSLKGVSANLSLVKIRTLSIELEHLLKENADYSECLDNLKRAIGITLEKITEFLG